MAKRIGYDGASYGLLKRGYTNDDPKYTAVANEGGVTLYALHPKHFNPAGVSHLKTLFTKPGVTDETLDTRIFVGSVDVKGFKTHGEFLTDTLEFAPIKAINNPISGINPHSYAQQLVAGTADKYAPFYLNYGVTIDPLQINILDLPNIEINADTVITVSIGDKTITKPLTHLLNPARLVDPILTIAPGYQTANGFFFEGDFAGTNFSSVYSSGLTQSAIVNDYAQHMIKNKSREAALIQSTTYQSAIGILSSIGSGFDVVGGIGSVMDALFEWGLRDSMFNDMKNSISNIGGDVIHDPIGDEIDVLVTITYPIRKPMYTTGGGVQDTIYPADFEINSSKSFNVHRTFDSISEFIEFSDNSLKGEVIGGRVEPVVEYGEYTKWFERIIGMGGLS